MAEELPLVHTSLSEHLPHFAGVHQIIPKWCEVFQENLVYLFYGRPAYRSSKGQLPGESVLLCPMCFVFRPHSVPKRPARIFPCDTGAVYRNRFRPYLTKQDLSGLELDSRIESARRLVPLFFSTNRNYFYGKAVTSLNVTSGSVAHRFHQLLLAKGPRSFDDRKSVVEVQVREPVSLRDKLSFVVLPLEFLDYPKVRKAILEDWKCDAEPYCTTQGAAPGEYYAIVRNAIEERFKRATRI
jgi:hypothetical protein